jgi:hypothetical protein
MNNFSNRRKLLSPPYADNLETEDPSYRYILHKRPKHRQYDPRFLFLPSENNFYGHDGTTQQDAKTNGIMTVLSPQHITLPL